MTAADQRAAALVERFLAFDYDYPMTCDGCGRNSRVPARVYWEESQNDALAPCEHCGHEIHFGPAVVALRDTGDPALSDDVTNLAWYHTSKYRDWPAEDEYVAEVGARLLQVSEALSSLPPKERERVLDFALHVGTYEAAIESMFLRMFKDNESDRVFYLHRVSLNIAPTEINAGFRDENHEAASRLTRRELGALRAVRYLNVQESPGSISLAIHPAAISSVQTLPLPRELLAPGPSAGVVETVARIDRELTAVAAEMPDTSGIKRSDLRYRVMLARLDGDALAPPNVDTLALQVDECEERISSAWDKLDEVLSREYLAGVGPAVQDDFVSAMAAWRHHTNAPTAGSYHQHFRAHSAALTRERDITAEIARQPADRGQGRR